MRCLTLGHYRDIFTSMYLNSFLDFLLSLSISVFVHLQDNKPSLNHANIVQSSCHALQLQKRLISLKV